MPAVKAGAPAAGEVVVRIDQLEDWAQLAFEGYKCAPASLSGRSMPERFLGSQRCWGPKETLHRYYIQWNEGHLSCQ